MIDIHSHFLPGVDDGPGTLEETLEMIGMAYEEGVRCAIVTPHLNHPLEFKSNPSIETIYKQTRDIVIDRYKNFGLVLGAELYITSDYIKVLETKPYHFTIGTTNYVLIEFDRNIDKAHVLDVIHEMIVRNYRPILAHVEMYPRMIAHVDTIRELRNAGAYIQITGSSLLGKQGSEITSFLRKLIRFGLVDFIASDAHGIKSRRPLLKDAYQTVIKLTSQRDADRIFSHNPKALIAGKHIPQPSYAPKTGYSKVVRFNIIAASFALLLISSSILLSLLNRDQAESTTQGGLADTVIEEVIEEFDLEAVDRPDEVIPSSDATTSTEEVSNGSEATGSETQAVTFESQGATSETQAETETTTELSQSEIESKYYEALTRLKADYIERLEGIVANIKVAQSNISDEKQRKSLIDGYVQDIMNLESQSDNTVYDLLYVMQNELEDHRYDVSKVKEMREEYQRVKDEKQSEYLAELGY